MSRNVSQCISFYFDNYIDSLKGVIVQQTFYTVSELEEMLKLSKSQLYALIENGRLRCHRFTRGKSGAIRVSQTQLDDYLRVTEDTGEPSTDTEPRLGPTTARSKGEFAFLPPK